MAKSKRSMVLGGGLEVAAADAVYTLLDRPWIHRKTSPN